MRDSLKDHLFNLPTTPVLDVHGKWVQLRNARTGTTSIDEGPLRHRCLMRNRNRSRWDDTWGIVTDQFEPFIFTFVRNPWDRICSAFHQCRDRTKTPENQISRRWWFADWVKRVLAKKGPDVNRHFAEQYPTAYFEGERFGFVGRFENIEEDWATVAGMIEADPQLPHWNAARYGSYVEHYDDESRMIIGELYSREIEAFEYTFGE